MDIDQVVSSILESALNRYFSLDPDAMMRFSTLEGKVIAIEIKGLNKMICLFLSADGFLVLSDFDGEADATIHGSPIALAKMALADDPRDLLFRGEISISGDSALANRFNQLLTQADIDWEEILASKVGDIAAHKVGNFVRDAQHWFTRGKQSAYMDGGEYIQEEVKLSPSNAELRKFIRQVDDVREAADRLKARIDILKAR